MLTVILASAVLLVPVRTLRTGFLQGGDVSEIPQVEARGGRYFYHGQAMGPFEIMKKAGWNFIRLRVWNHPADGFCDEAHTLAMAKRAKAAGIQFGIDFHYSDYWADPGKQYKPAAWKNLDFPQLVDAVETFTRKVIGDLVSQGTPPVIVQIGNEIRAGMLWPDGKVASDDPVQWSHLAALVRAGLRGVHEAEGSNRIVTMIHLDRGGDNAGAVWWFEHLKPYHVDFDAIGLSYYPFWHGHLAAFQANVNDLARRYKKDIYVAETAYPWTSSRPGFKEIFSNLELGYPATPEGQAGFLAKVMDIVRHIPEGHGKGLFYWAPMWISSPKANVPWDTLATFDDHGRALPAVDVLGGHIAAPVGGKP